LSAPLHFKELQIRNFMSFGNNVTCIDLSDFGTTLIQGHNVDSGGANGAGKTTTINALCYALYNKPFDNISLQKLLNSTNSTKNTLMEVKLIFDKGEHEYEIYRCRGESFNINIMKDGEDITLDSVTENDKLVQEIVGMSYDLFTKIIIFSGNSTPFLLMPLAHQRNQIEELFNITMLTEKAIKLKEIIKTTESDAQIKAAVIKELENYQTEFKRQVTSAEQRVTKWEAEKITKIEALKQERNKLDNIDIEQEKELHSLLDILSAELNDHIVKANVLDKDVNSLSKSVAKLAAEIEHLVDEKCPYCLQKFAEAGTTLQEKEALFDQQDARHDVLEKELNEKRIVIAELSSQIKEAKQLMHFKSLSEVVKAELAAQTADEKIADLEAAKNPHIEALQQLNQQVMKEIPYAELDHLKKEQEHQQFLLKLLIDKNSFIRKRIINKTIPFLNKRLIEYTKELGLPHIVKFDDDMSCTVSEYGRELDFGNLSSGEKKRVNLSLSLAFRDVLHHLHSKVNSLFIDEIDASLDGSGVENVFRLLKQKTRNDGLGLWIISHRPEASGRFDRTITIRKENGFSRIVEDEPESEL
jgi:DNA repair exonuclease SbcCD ATPase subunit